MDDVRFFREEELPQAPANQNPIPAPVNQVPVQPINPPQTPVETPQPIDSAPPIAPQPVARNPQAVPQYGADLNAAPSLSSLQLFSHNPYPTLTNVVPSSRTVCVLKSLAYGRKSEMTTLTGYLYQDWITEFSYPEISKMLETIAESEMRHLDALSRAIVAFGGNPNFRDQCGGAWTAGNISTCKNLIDFLQTDIRGEEGAIKHYQKAMCEVDNESLQALFARIIEDEELHLIALHEILRVLE